MSERAILIIPARGGSKRIPRKNARLFLGEPMIARAIALARDSDLFARIIVSTDDPEIAGIARARGAETPFIRPPELADDHAGTRPVIVHAIGALNPPIPLNTIVACLYPCTPLLRSDDLAAGVALLKKSGDPGAFAFPVVALPIPIERALRRDDGGTVRPIDQSGVLMRSQDLEPAWRDAGQFYFGRCAAWLGDRAIFDGAASLVLPPERAVDIDTEEDWRLAEVLARAKWE